MKVLVFQHSPVDHAGLLGVMLNRDSTEMTTLRLDKGEVPTKLMGYDLLIDLGGPQDVWEDDVYPWLTGEKALIREAVLNERIPFLGICLGAQLLADALGGEVGAMAHPEIDVGRVTLTDAGTSDPIFDGIGPDYWSLHWHGAEIKQIPSGGKVLARSPKCAVQAFRIGDCAYGVQSHIEFTEYTVNDWLQVASYKQFLVDRLGEAGMESFEAASRQRAADGAIIARRIYGNFLKIAGLAQE